MIRSDVAVGRRLHRSRSRSARDDPRVPHGRGELPRREGRAANGPRIAGDSTSASRSMHGGMHGRGGGPLRGGVAEPIRADPSSAPGRRPRRRTFAVTVPGSARDSGRSTNRAATSSGRPSTSTPPHRGRLAAELQRPSIGEAVVSASSRTGRGGRRVQVGGEIDSGDTVSRPSGARSVTAASRKRPRRRAGWRGARRGGLLGDPASRPASPRRAIAGPLLDEVMHARPPRSAGGRARPRGGATAIRPCEEASCADPPPEATFSTRSGEHPSSTRPSLTGAPRRSESRPSSRSRPSGAEDRGSRRRKAAARASNASAAISSRRIHRFMTAIVRPGRRAGGLPRRNRITGR